MELTMNQKIPTIHGIDRLLEYLPYFQDQTNQFYEIVDKPPQFPFASYSGMVSQFYKDLYHENMIQSFDWPGWTHEAHKYINDPEILNQADITIIQKLFTSIIRADRFNEGVLGRMIDQMYSLYYYLLYLRRYNQIPSPPPGPVKLMLLCLFSSSY